MTVSLVTRHQEPSYVPLGLLYLKAALVEAGVAAERDVHVLEFAPAACADEIADAIVATGPAVVGLSCYVWNVTALLAVARAIKHRRPDTLVVAGGPEVGPVGPDLLRRHHAIDVVVRSEGEVPLPEIVAARRAKTSLADVAGIDVRVDQQIVSTPDAPLIDDLNGIPSPHLARYADYTGRVVCFETQRGCVFRCNFCFYNKDYSVRNRRFDLERVKEELLFWLGQDVAEIYFMDPVFNLNPARTREICRFLAGHNHRRIPLHAEIWAEFVDDEMAALMRAASFVYLEVGLQTTDATALATAERRLKLQKFVEGMAHLKHHGLTTQLQLIHGLPGDTRAAFRRSLDFAMSLDPDQLAVFPLMVLPGTELWHKAAALKLSFDPEPPYFARSHLSMTEEDFAYGRRAIAACRVLESSRTIRFLAREPGLTFSAIVDAWLDWAPGDAPDLTLIPEFVNHLCAEHGLPRGFYERVAARERA
jgi:radical SAM superfamily enzyme YgiQ (UPF0313 family)